MGAGKRFWGVVCSGFVVAAAVGTFSHAGAPHVPGEFIVKFKPGTTGLHSLAQNDWHALSGGAQILNVRALKTDPSLARIRLADDSSLQGVMQNFRSDPRIERVEPNYLYRMSASGVPNDPKFKDLWHLSNTGQSDSSGAAGKPGADIGVLPVWEAGQTGSEKIVVAVIDTGIQWDHPDLAQNLYTNVGESGALANNRKDDDGNGFIDDTHGWNFAKSGRNSSDDQGHGTHCAGSIGARGDNGTGVAGVNWGVSLMPVKFLDSQGSGSLEGALESIKYATLMKVNVMSNSWGGGGHSALMLEAIEAARNAGILFVAAAGNDGSDNDAQPTYPASYEVDNVVSVAALDNQDVLASFSNFGKRSVHVAAPGVRILSTYMGSTYKSLSGTSMACPQVSGIAALMLAADSSLSYSEIKSRLIRTSDSIRGLRSTVLARGRVNAFQAVNNIAPPSNEPDPNAWVDVARKIESRHPYTNNADLVFQVREPGAKFIRVVFDRIQTEKQYDSVSVEDASGVVSETFSGKYSNVTSDYVAGDQLQIRLSSDTSYTEWGFAITRIQVIK